VRDYVNLAVFLDEINHLEEMARSGLTSNPVFIIALMPRKRSRCCGNYVFRLFTGNAMLGNVIDVPIVPAELYLSVHLNEREIQ